MTDISAWPSRVTLVQADKVNSGVKLRAHEWQCERFRARTKGECMTVKRMDNVGIVVESLDAVVPFLTPPVVADHRNAPVNALGYLRVMFAVDDMDDTLTRLRGHGAQLVGEVVQYEDVYRLCYTRGPEGLLIGLAEELESRDRA